eukprot:2525168-Prymnesium_polylepis.1
MERPTSICWAESLGVSAASDGGSLTIWKPSGASRGAGGASLSSSSSPSSSSTFSTSSSSCTARVVSSAIEAARRAAEVRARSEVRGLERNWAARVSSSGWRSRVLSGIILLE